MTCRGASQDPSVTEPQRDGGGEADGEGSIVRKEPSQSRSAPALPEGRAFKIRFVHKLKKPFAFANGFSGYKP